MKQRFSVIFTTLFFLVFIFSTHDLFAFKLGIFPHGQKPGGMLFGMSVLFGCIIALGIHELGHLLMGLAMGFRFELYVVFLLGIKRTEKGISVYLNKDFGYMGGVAATIPVKKETANRRKFAWVLLAGPLTSLLFSALCLLLLIYTKSDLNLFFLMAGASSLGVFLATTIPSKTGMYFTDRARFQRMISNGPDGRSEEALLGLLAQYTIDNSCKNISLEDARLIQHDREAFIRFWGYYYEYEYFRANNNPEMAAEPKKQLDTMQNTVSKAVWKALKLDA